MISAALDRLGTERGKMDGNTVEQTRQTVRRAGERQRAGPSDAPSLRIGLVGGRKEEGGGGGEVNECFNPPRSLSPGDGYLNLDG